MEKVPIPTWGEVLEKQESIESRDRTIEECVRNGDALNPLEKLIYDNEPHGDDFAKRFRKDVSEAIEWVIENYTKGRL